MRHKKSSTLEKILIATEKEVAIHGFSGMLNKRILQDAGVSNSGAINYYFDNQEDLIYSSLRYTQSISMPYQRRLKQILLARHGELHFMDYLAFVSLPVVYCGKRFFPEPYCWGLQYQTNIEKPDIPFLAMVKEEDQKSVMQMTQHVIDHLSKITGQERIKEYFRMQRSILVSIMADNEREVRRRLAQGEDPELMKIEYDVMTVDALEIVASGITRQPMSWQFADYMEVIEQVDSEIDFLEFSTRDAIIRKDR